MPLDRSQMDDTCISFLWSRASSPATAEDEDINSVKSKIFWNSESRHFRSSTSSNVPMMARAPTKSFLNAEEAEDYLEEEKDEKRAVMDEDSMAVMAAGAACSTPAFPPDIKTEAMAAESSSNCHASAASQDFAVAAAISSCLIEENVLDREIQEDTRRISEGTEKEGTKNGRPFYERMPIVLPEHTKELTGCEALRINSDWLASHPWSCELLCEHEWLDQKFLRLSSQTLIAPVNVASSLNDISSSSGLSHAEVCKQKGLQILCEPLDAAHETMPTATSSTESFPAPVTEDAPMPLAPNTVRCPAWVFWQKDENFVNMDSAYAAMPPVPTYRLNQLMEAVKCKQHHDPCRLKGISNVSTEMEVHNSFPVICHFADHLERAINDNLGASLKEDAEDTAGTMTHTGAVVKSEAFQQCSPSQNQDWSKKRNGRELDRMLFHTQDSAVAMEKDSFLKEDKRMQCDTEKGSNVRGEAVPFFGSGASKKHKGERRAGRLNYFLPQIGSFHHVLDAAIGRKVVEGKSSPFSPDPEYFEWQARSGGQHLPYTWDRETTPIGYLPPLCNCDNEEYHRLYRMQQEKDADMPIVSDPEGEEDVVHSTLKRLDGSTIDDITTTTSAKHLPYVQVKGSNSKKLTQLPSVCTNKSCQGLLFVPYSFIEVPLNREIDGVVRFSKIVSVPSDTELYCANTKHTLILVTRSPEHEYLCWKALELKNLSAASLIYDVDQGSFQPYSQAAPTRASADTSASLKSGHSTSIGSLGTFNQVATSFAVNQSTFHAPGTKDESSSSRPNSARLSLEGSKQEDKAAKITFFAPHRRVLTMRLRNTKSIAASTLPSADTSSEAKLCISTTAALKQLMSTLPLNLDIDSDDSEVLSDTAQFLEKLSGEDADFCRSSLLYAIDSLIAGVNQPINSHVSDASSDSAESITEEELEELAICKPLSKALGSDIRGFQEKLQDFDETAMHRPDISATGKSQSAKRIKAEEATGAFTAEMMVLQDLTATNLQRSSYANETIAQFGVQDEVEKLPFGERQDGSKYASVFEPEKVVAQQPLPKSFENGGWLLSPYVELKPSKSSLKQSTVSSFGQVEKELPFAYDTQGYGEESSISKPAAPAFPQPSVGPGIRNQHAGTPREIFQDNYARNRPPCLFCGSQDHTVDDGCTAEGALSALRIFCSSNRTIFLNDNYLSELCSSLNSFFVNRREDIVCRREDCKIVAKHSCGNFLLPINKPLPKKYENQTLIIGPVFWVFKSCACKFNFDKPYRPHDSGNFGRFSSRMRYVDNLISPTASAGKRDYYTATNPTKKLVTADITQDCVIPREKRKSPSKWRIA